jgi:hypothetical protein
MSNPIKYTSRDFDSILSDINSDVELIDKPNWFKRLIAGIGDIFSMWENASTNNMFLRTAYTRRSVEYLLELIDYQLNPQSTSSGYVMFNLKGTTSFPITVTAANMVALSPGNIAVASKRFEALTASTVAAVTEIVAAASVNVGAGYWTVATDYVNGTKCRLTGTDLPLGLSTGTDYYIRRITSVRIGFSNTLSGALSNTDVAPFSDAGTGNHTINVLSFSKLLYQQETKTQYSVGTSDGSTAWQEFDLKDLLILKTTLLVSINSVTWTRVDTFINSSSTDTHYRLLYNSDGSSFIMFGDGTYGAIPGTFPILVTYAVGGGADSNISIINGINVYAGSDTNIDACFNYTTFTGGADEEPIENAKITAPMLLKARDRFVTTGDGIALALNYGGSSQAFINKNAYGILSAQVLCIATGGGNLSGATKTALQAYLIDRTVLESIDVRVENITYTTEAVTSAAKILSGYSWTDVEPLFRLAWKLFFSETGYEIYQDFISNGIESATTLINTIFTESFTPSYYTAIQKLLIPLINNYRTVGDTIQVSDAYSYIQANVDGIDYMTISAPTFPITNAITECTTIGVLTLSQI